MRKIVFLLVGGLITPITLHASAGSGGPEENLIPGFILLLGLFLFYLLASKAKLPGILGAIGAGIAVTAIGPYIGLADNTYNKEPWTTLGMLGVCLLMFRSGLEAVLDDIKRNWKTPLLVAVFGVIFVGLLGYGAAHLLLPQETHWLAYLAVGLCLTPTSAGIAAALFGAKNQMSSAAGTTTLIAAVMDDVIGLIILAVLTALGESVTSGKAFEIMDLFFIVLKAGGFIVGGIALGKLLAPYVFKKAYKLEKGGGSYKMMIFMSLLFALAFVIIGYKLAGLAPLIGAYVAGVILEKAHYTTPEGDEHELEEIIEKYEFIPLYIFFFLIGTQVPLAQLANPYVLLVAGVLTIATVIGKFLSGLAIGKSIPKLPVIFGMTPRGEVAAIMIGGARFIKIDGKSIIPDEIFTAFILMVVFTTLIGILGLNKVLPFNPSNRE